MERKPPRRTDAPRKLSLRLFNDWQTTSTRR
jgi:hypothetical protein